MLVIMIKPYQELSQTQSHLVVLCSLSMYTWLGKYECCYSYCQVISCTVSNTLHYQLESLIDLHCITHKVVVISSPQIQTHIATYVSPGWSGWVIDTIHQNTVLIAYSWVYILTNAEMTSQNNCWVSPSFLFPMFAASNYLIYWPVI